MEKIGISCDTCSAAQSSACDDCVVSFLLAEDHQGAHIIDFEEAKALRKLSAAGLSRPVRFSPRSLTGGNSGKP